MKSFGKGMYYLYLSSLIPKAEDSIDELFKKKEQVTHNLIIIKEETLERIEVFINKCINEESDDNVN